MDPNALAPTADEIANVEAVITSPEDNTHLKQKQGQMSELEPDLKQQLQTEDPETMAGTLKESVTTPTAIAPATDVVLAGELKAAQSKVDEATADVEKALETVVQLKEEKDKVAKIAETSAAAAADKLKVLEDTSQALEVAKKQKEVAEAVQAQVEELATTEMEKIKAKIATKEAEAATMEAEKIKEVATSVATKAVETAEAATAVAQDVQRKMDKVASKALAIVDPAYTKVIEGVQTTSLYPDLCVGFFAASETDASKVMAVCKKMGDVCPATFREDSCTLLEPIKSNLGSAPVSRMW